MRVQNKQVTPVPEQQGVVLLEALIAILIFSMGILAVIGLQAAMIKNTTDAKFRSEATVIAQQRVGLIWSNPANLGTYAEADTDISAILPGGTRSTVQTAVGEFLITVNWTPPHETGTPETHSFAMIARVAGG